MLLKNQHGRIVAVHPSRAKALLDQGFKKATQSEVDAWQAKHAPARESQVVPSVVEAEEDVEESDKDRESRAILEKMTKKELLELGEQLAADLKPSWSNARMIDELIPLMNAND